MEKRQIPLTCGIPGTETAITAFCYGPVQGVRKVYVQASLHADELPGSLAAWQLCERLQALELQERVRAQIVVVPLCNPLGLRQKLLYSHVGRFDLATGQNFNRLRTIAFYAETLARLQAEGVPVLGQDAGANRETIRAAMRAALDERQPGNMLEALHIALLRLACDADLVLDLHCDKQAVLHLYTLPQLWPHLEPLACWLGSQCQIVSEDSQARSFDEVVSVPWVMLQQVFPDANIPLACHGVTVELRGENDLSRQWAQQDANAILQYLHHLGDVCLPADEIRPMPALANKPHPLSGLVYVAAPVAGIVIYHVQPGVWVKQGELLAEVIDPVLPRCVPVYSPIEGFVFATDNQRFAHPQNTLLSLSGRSDMGHIGLSP